jgi:hypothetical protein
MEKSVEQIRTSVLGLNITEFKKECAALDKIIDGISFGDIITDEDFKTLEKYVEGARNLFFETTEGF